MRQEIEQLINMERPEVVRKVAWAAGNGDRSENGDYIYGKRRLREIDRRVRFLTKRLESATIVDPPPPGSPPPARVVFGTHVRVLDLDSDLEMTFRIVGGDETGGNPRIVSGSSAGFLR